MTQTSFTFTLAALALAVSGAMAQGTSPGTGSGSTSPSVGMPRSADTGSRLARADAGFIKDAAKAGLAEVESSQLALQKASDPAIKSFAQKMVDDHTKANEELKALAQTKGVELPDDPSLMQKGKMKALSTADGANFDRRYAESMGVKAHEDTVKLFQKAANTAKDADVKAFATKTLPTLQEHLKMARDLHATHSAKK